MDKTDDGESNHCMLLKAQDQGHNRWAQLGRAQTVWDTWLGVTGFLGLSSSSHVHTGYLWTTIISIPP